MKKRVFTLSPNLFGSSRFAALCCILFLFTGFSNPVSAQRINFGKQGTTRAIIIGISQYANDEIEDLQFADKDAESYYNYIISPAGGSVDPENIQLLINEDATYGQINLVMDWLMENSEDGDRAIIYFSGHGDVETVSKRKQGFLLTYDSPSKVYRAGAYPIYYLQITLETLADANVETIVITDACRSGKLAGNDFGGTQATALALQQQFANEIKIMSCQPNEFSLEGTQWGGGRSVFSYHLVQGMMGLADEDQDGVVTLMEIGRYLEDQVTRAVAPKQQIPLVEGDRNSPVALVDESTLQNLIGEINPSLAEQFDPSDKKGNQSGEGLYPGDLSEEAQSLLKSFNSAMEIDDLFGEDTSAYSIYQKIAENEELTEFRNKLSRQLSTAFQEEAQKAINLYLESDASELNDRWNFSEKYARYPIYLEKAAELLPADHYSLSWLKCNQLYFEGMLLRLDWENNKEDKSKLLKARSLQLQALSYDEYSSHVYNELGLIYSDLGDVGKEIESYQKALELSPTWAMPNSNLAVAYMQAGQPDKALPYAEKAIKEKPNQPVFYLNMSIIYYNLGSFTNAQESIKKAIALDNKNWAYQLKLGQFLLYDGKVDSAKDIFKQIEELCWDHPICLNDLATEYYMIEDFEKYYSLLNRGMKQVKRDDVLYIMLQNNLIYYYLAVEDYATFESTCLKLIDEDIARESTIVELASYYAMNDNDEKALAYLTKAFELGYSDLKRILDDSNFDKLKNKESFRDLIEKYK